MGAKLSGSSGKRYAIDQNSDINVTPFVDVMLVLLIIFMVAAPLATQSLKIDLPPPTPPMPNPPKVQLVLIQIQDNGDVYIGIKDQTPSKITLDALPGEVVRLWGVAGLAGDKQKVTIRTGEHVHYGEFMDVLNTLEKNGITKIGLALEET